MRAGRLTKRITFQVQQASKDSAGGSAYVSADVCTVSAGVKNLPSDEVRQTTHGGEQPVEKVEFTIRYRRDIDSTMRIVYKGNIFNITHVNNVNEDNEKLVIAAHAGSEVA
jgi:SPP1 family predicted phage head-tail adaptor